MSENTLPYNQLVVLIYRHLMDNGYQNVANALKKHAPQEVWGPVDVSLIGIYSWWRSQNPSSASEQVDVPRHAAGKTRTRRPSANTSRKCSTTEGVRQEDSDSDTCLDVEKWRRRVSQISDADRAKMDILSNLDNSTGISKGTIKKQTHAKNQRISTGEGKTSSAKSTELPAKTKPTTRRTKKDEKKDAAAISNPEKGNMASTNEYGPNKADVQAEDVGVSLFSNVNNTSKASEAQEQNETFAPAEVEDPSKTSKTPSKKAKKKKRSSDVGETADHNQSCSEDVSSSTVSQCEGANLNTSINTPMTPMVSSTLKSKTKLYDSTCDETPSKKGKTKKCKTLSKLDQDALSNEPDVCLEAAEKLSSSKKAKHKTLDSETPSQKRKAKNLLSTTQPEAAETPRSKLKDKSNIHSVKSNGNAEMNNVHESGEQSDILSETLFIGTTGDMGDDEIACGEVKSKKKKKKRKREEACEVSLFEEPEPEPKKFKKAKNKGTGVDASPALAEDVLAGEEENRKKKKKKTEESVSPVVVETISHKKKEKKKKKNQNQNEEVSMLNGT